MDELRAEIEALKARIEALEAEKSTVRAPFRVVDDEGRLLFGVAIHANGTGACFLANAEGRPAVLLVTTDQGGFVSVANAESVPTILIGPADGHGRITIGLDDSGDRNVLAIGANPDGSGFVAVTDESGESSVRLFVDTEAGTGGLEVTGREGLQWRFPK